MDKVTAQMEKRTNYSLSEEWLRGESVADDDDKESTTVRPQIRVAAIEYWGSFCLHSPVFIVRSDNQNFSCRAVGGGGVSSYIARWKRWGGGRNRWSMRYYRWLQLIPDPLDKNNQHKTLPNRRLLASKRLSASFGKAGLQIQHPEETADGLLSNWIHK